MWSNREAALQLRMDGSPASRTVALQLEMKAGARVGFCWESHHHRKQNKLEQDWSEERNTLVIFPTVFLDLAPKRL